MPKAKKDSMRMKLARLITGDPELGYAGAARTGLGSRKYMTDSVYTDAVAVEVPFRTYKRMRFHPKVKVAMGLLKKALSSAEISFVADNDEVRQFLEEQWDSKTFKEFMVNALLSLDYGWQPIELIYGFRNVNFRSTPLIFVDKFRAPSPDTCEPEYDEFGTPTGIKQDEMIVPIEKVVIVTNEKEHGNLKGISHMRAAHAPWRAQEIIMTSALRYFERAGQPTLKIQYPKFPKRDEAGEVTGDENLDAAKRMEKNVRQSGVIFYPYEEGPDNKNKWVIEWLSDEQRGDMFVDFINHLNSEIMLALLVPPRVYDISGKVGTYNMVQGFQEMLLITLGDTLQSIANHANEYINKRLIEANFGEGIKGEIKFSAIDPRIISAIIALVQYLANTGQLDPEIKAHLQAKLATMFGIEGISVEDLLSRQEEADEKKQELATMFQGNGKPDKKETGATEQSGASLSRSVSAKEAAIGITSTWATKLANKIKKSNDLLLGDMKSVIHTAKNDADSAISQIFMMEKEQRLATLESIRKQNSTDGMLAVLPRYNMIPTMQNALDDHYGRMHEIGRDDAIKQMVWGKGETYEMSDDTRIMLMSRPEIRAGEIVSGLNNTLYYLLMEKLNDNTSSVRKAVALRIDQYFADKIRKTDGMEIYRQTQIDILLPQLKESLA